MIDALHRRGRYRVRITVDLLTRPDWSDQPAAVLHRLAWEHFTQAMAEAEVSVEPDRTEVTWGYFEEPAAAEIGQKTYVWIFTFPLPFLFPTADFN